VCSHGSFAKDNMKIDDLSLGGLELGEVRLEKPVKESLCQEKASKTSSCEIFSTVIFVYHLSELQS